MKYVFFWVVLVIVFPFEMMSQVTFSKDIAPIIFNHCTSCHRPGEIGPMSLTNYEEVRNWASTIKYVTSQKIMPPWKADHTYARYLDENFLNDQQINAISAWVNEGSPLGDENEIPPLPIFPENSLLGKPDLVLNFASSYTHKGNGKDEYRYFVLPTGITQNKKIKAIELRPGNTKIVHHALFFADQSGKARQYDLNTPEYGFSSDENPDFDVFEVINREQYTGYVPGQKPRYYPEGLAQDLPANSDLVIQMHYAPWSVDEKDSSSVNIFFAKDNEVIDRKVNDYIMLPFNLVTGPASFVIQPNKVTTFEGTYTLPFDVSIMGIFPHMHYLGKKWEVYIENQDGTKTNLIKINDWDFNWQGGYYFDRYKIAKKGSKIRAFATYDNTTNNPFNPTNPPKKVTWGEGSKDEMYYLPLLYVPYRSGDENIIFDQQTVSTQDLVKEQIKINVFPNPIIAQQQLPVHIEFDLKNGQALQLALYDRNGTLVKIIRDQEYFSQGSHIVHLETRQLLPGSYFVRFAGRNLEAACQLMILDK